MKKSEKEICFLIGNPVKHSLSPGMHSVIYKELDLNWEYRLKQLDEKDIPKFIEEVKDMNNCRGFNVTVPYKEKIVGFLDSVSDAAEVMGAVNTVKVEKQKLSGFNTDWIGFRDDLKNSLGYFPQGKKALVIGAGGGARAVIYALAQEMARETRYENIMNEAIYVYDIDEERTKKIISEFSDMTNSNLPAVRKVSRDKLDEVISEADLIVNATPVGMQAGDPVIDLKQKEVKKDLKVYDLVYNRETELVSTARELGLKAVGGAGMLAGQGAAAFTVWSHIEVTRKIKEKMKDYVINEVKKND